MILSTLLVAVLPASIALGDITSSDIHVTPSHESAPILVAQNSEPVRQNGFIAQFDDCLRIADEKVKCEFLIKNDQNLRRSLGIYTVQLFDTTGNVTTASRIYFSGQNSSGMDLPPNVIVRGVAEFREMPRNTAFTHMAVEFYSNGRFMMDFPL